MLHTRGRRLGRLKWAWRVAGLSTRNDGIIEIGAIAESSGERWETLVNPGLRQIARGAFMAHGISQGMVQQPAVPSFRCVSEPLMLSHRDPLISQHSNVLQG